MAKPAERWKEDRTEHQHPETPRSLFRHSYYPLEILIYYSLRSESKWKKVQHLVWTREKTSFVADLE